MSKEFQIGNTKIIFAGNINRYNALWQDLCKKIPQYKEKFNTRYNSCHDIETVSEKMEGYGLDLIAELLDYFGPDFEARGMHDFNALDYLHKYKDVYSIFKPYFLACSNIQETLQGEVDARKQEELRRELKKANRFQLQGGGFGLSGAAKGIIVAESINLVTSVAYSAFDLVGDLLFGSPGIDKDAMYRQSRDLLWAALSASMHKLMELLAYYLECPISFDLNKFQSILQNIENDKINSNDRQNAFNEAILANPYEPKIYMLYCMYFNEYEKEIVEMASFFGYNLEQFIEDIHHLNGFYFKNVDITALAKKEQEDIKKALQTTYGQALEQKVFTEEFWLQQDDMKKTVVLLNYLISVYTARVEQAKGEELKAYYQYMVDKFNAKKTNLLTKGACGEDYAGEKLQQQIAQVVEKYQESLGQYSHISVGKVIANRSAKRNFAKCLGEEVLTKKIYICSDYSTAHEGLLVNEDGVYVSHYVVLGNHIEGIESELEKEYNRQYFIPWKKLHKIDFYEDHTIFFYPRIGEPVLYGEEGTSLPMQVMSDFLNEILKIYQTQNAVNKKLAIFQAGIPSAEDLTVLKQNIINEWVPDLPKSECWTTGKNLTAAQEKIAAHNFAALDQTIIYKEAYLLIGFNMDDRLMIVDDLGLAIKDRSYAPKIIPWESITSVKYERSYNEPEKIIIRFNNGADHLISFFSNSEGVRYFEPLVGIIQQIVQLYLDIKETDKNKKLQDEELVENNIKDVSANKKELLIQKYSMLRDERLPVYILDDITPEMKYSAQMHFATMALGCTPYLLIDPWSKSGRWLRQAFLFCSKGIFIADVDKKDFSVKNKTHIPMSDLINARIKFDEGAVFDSLNINDEVVYSDVEFESYIKTVTNFVNDFMPYAKLAYCEEKYILNLYPYCEVLACMYADGEYVAKDLEKSLLLRLEAGLLCYDTCALHNIAVGYHNGCYSASGKQDLAMAKYWMEQAELSCNKTRPTDQATVDSIDKALDLYEGTTAASEGYKQIEFTNPDYQREWEVIQGLVERAKKDYITIEQFNRVLTRLLQEYDKTKLENIFVDNDAPPQFIQGVVGMCGTYLATAKKVLLVAYTFETASSPNAIGFFTNGFVNSLGLKCFYDDIDRIILKGKEIYIVEKGYSWQRLFCTCLNEYKARFIYELLTHLYQGEYQCNKLQEEKVLKDIKLQTTEINLPQNVIINYLAQYAPGLGSKFFLAPNIAAKKIENAVKAYAKGVPAEEVLLLYDASLTGSGKDGFLVSRHGIYRSGGDPITYGALKSVWYGDGRTFVLQKDGKKKNICLNLDGQEDYWLAILLGCLLQGQFIYGYQSEGKYPLCESVEFVVSKADIEQAIAEPSEFTLIKEEARVVEQEEAVMSAASGAEEAYPIDNNQPTAQVAPDGMQHEQQTIADDTGEANVATEEDNSKVSGSFYGWFLVFNVVALFLLALIIDFICTYISGTLADFIMIISLIAAVILVLIMTSSRLDTLQKHQALLLLLFIPWINLAFFIYLIFAKTPGVGPKENN